MTTACVGIVLVCQRCKHEWSYKGAQKYVVACPSCKTSVSLSRAKKKNKKEDS